VLIRFAAIFGLAVCLVGDASGQIIPPSNYQNSLAPSDAMAHADAPPQRETAVPYAPITLRGPSTSLSQQATRTDSGELQSRGDSTFEQSAQSAVSPPTRLSEGAATRRSTTTPLVTITSSLALVLGLFAALVWVSRKAQKGRGISRPIPDEVLRVLGQKQLGSLGTISIVRCGRTVMIVSQSASGLHSLATITDEAEVRHLEAVCLGESAASFQAALGEIEREPAGRGFLGEGISQPNARKKLFAQA
jgi:flagellar biogenesis protein FliO